MSKILESTSIKDRTVIEIMQEQNLSHSTAYKKTQQLLKFGLLVRYKSEINDGKKITYYKSKFRSFDIHDEGLSTYKIEVISNKHT